MKLSTEWIQDYVRIRPPYDGLAEKMTMAGLEVKHLAKVPGQGGWLMDVEVTTNRPDWLSHCGVAREIAAIEGKKYAPPAVRVSMARVATPDWTLSLKEKKGCPYYTGVYVEGISAAETPAFIRDRLRACGLRSVNLIVDITNFVLLETGQPLHAFDADLLRNREVVIRKAAEKETFVAIDGSTLSLSAGDVVIADAGRAVALAGVMGGRESEVHGGTRNIFLESAYFDPGRVRQSSRRHALTSESSYRFERGVDPEGVDLGRERALTLFKQYAKPK